LELLPADSRRPLVLAPGGPDRHSDSARHLPPELQGQADHVKEALGDKIIFSHQDERNFIAATEAPKILQDMQDRLLALAPGYFGHPDFAARFIRGKFRRRARTAALAAFR